jgi:hypothetical protein
MLIALVWNFVSVRGFSDGAFAVTDRAIDLTEYVTANGIAALEPYLGAFKPAK